MGSYFKPSEEEMAHELTVAETFAYRLARKSFMDCLIKNVRSQKNTSGRPEVCEELARMFAMIGGDEEIEKLTGVLKRVHTKHTKQ